MKRAASVPLKAGKRGRPEKFGRPARLVALTLPEDVLRALQTINSDVGWAIVQLAEPLTKSGAGSHHATELPKPAELAHLPKRRALIVVREPLLRDIAGVTMIPLADGRAFLAFDGSVGIADLELTLLDRVEAMPQGSTERASLLEFREILREWRLDPHLQFKTKSIIVVHGVEPNPVKRLGRLKSSGATRPTEDDPGLREI